MSLLRPSADFHRCFATTLQNLKQHPAHLPWDHPKEPPQDRSVHRLHPQPRTERTQLARKTRQERKSAEGLKPNGYENFVKVMIAYTASASSHSLHHRPAIQNRLKTLLDDEMPFKRKELKLKEAQTHRRRPRRCNKGILQGTIQRSHLFRLLLQRMIRPHI